MRRVLLTTISLLVGIALVCVGLGLTAVVKAASALSQQTQRERTLLDLRMESSREIRQALAKPLPHSEPLPPITARLRHAVGSAVASINPDRRKLMDEARGAFASPQWRSSGTQLRAYAEFDPHTLY
jgi:hypothetical protein